jgi:hypothetical protein
VTVVPNQDHCSGNLLLLNGLLDNRIHDVQPRQGPCGLLGHGRGECAIQEKGNDG